MNLDDKKIAVIGLGYVGLPLALEFARTRPVVGFDIRPERIGELRAGRDSTLEVDAGELGQATRIEFTDDAEALRQCGIFIVTVPTPIDKANRPDLKPLIRATETVGKVLREGGVVIYESTVYPGCTREVCVPLLEELSGLTLNEGFHVGYSPERANPGDRQHRLTTITKVTSGSTPEAADAIDALYGSIVRAGTHKASSIEVAEAAKVIENTQRDLNIALMNELAIIFSRLGIDTLEVLAAAQTKWNFLPFRPGLVGGHCIGVDPYYLTHKAQEAGYHPEVILAGRRINDGMGRYVADQVARLMMKRGFPVVGSRILVMGLAFKENCPDIRNSKAIDIVRELKQFNAEVDVWDPWISAETCREEADLDSLCGPPAPGVYDAVVVAVAHREFVEAGAAGVRALGKDGAVIYDVKGIFPKDETDGRL
ncbi:nucleotide sugar dehydrogenase [Mesorhizobium sp. YM1C-6-2]|uniref:nucleotide sugar dehydrogenase n=1 Tax=Mesorhizobium sp. YM1C-6-2 TaxID=1827501 RepID=UPI000EF1FE13|nr:nucleotide sugar dehydrogenase [Mesorhizobium sp. YM1C-6-2]RLP22101.1 nucleotide sugar dehydrogenase [Mesorhizobium sp. YM1C-6-2]